MRSGHVAFEDGRLTVAGPMPARSLSPSQIERIYVCRMEDPVHHGDESFHLLLLDAEFLLIGPFVAGGLGAVDALFKDRPDIPVEQRLVRKVPYRYRAGGFLGLRLFPVPALRFGPVSDLARFHLVTREESHGRR